MFKKDLNPKFTKKEANGDTVLMKLIKETAEELDISADLVWRVYSHFYSFIYDLMTKDNMIPWNTKKRMEIANNITLPGAGRLLNKYGKLHRLYKKKKDGKDKNQDNSNS